MVSYEWGVMYFGMLFVVEVMGDVKYWDYVVDCFKFIVEVVLLFVVLVVDLLWVLVVG